MTNLASLAHLGKSVHPTNFDFLADLDGTNLTDEAYRSFDLGPSTTLPLKLFAQNPPGSAAAVAAYLDGECQRLADDRCQRVYGVYHSLRRIADEAHLSISGLRKTALPWLVERGWLKIEKFTNADGHDCTMLWCVWRMPHYLDRATVDVTGTGLKLRVEGDQVDVIPSNESARCSARSETLSARSGAPEYKREFNTQKKTTTETGCCSSVQGDGNPDPQPLPPAPELIPAIAEASAIAVPPPCPAPARPSHELAKLPTELAEGIDEATARPSVRAKLRAEVMTWVGRVELAWVRLALLEYAAKEAIQDDPRPVILPERWFRSLLETWLEKGRPMPVLARAALEAQEKQAALARQAEADRQAAAAKRAEAARISTEDERRARWKEWPEADKGPLRDEYERDNPRPPGRADSGLVRGWELGREWWCADHLVESEVAR